MLQGVAYSEDEMRYSARTAGGTEDRGLEDQEADRASNEHDAGCGISCDHGARGEQTSDQ